MSNEKDKKDSRTDQAVKLMNKSTDLFNSATNLTNAGNITLTQVGELYNNSLKVKRDIAAINGWSNVELAKIAAKYKSCELFLNNTFGERRATLNKLYEVLDKAVENNDRESFIAAMKGMSDIVTSSPLEDFEKFAELYNDTSQPLLDF